MKDPEIKDNLIEIRSKDGDYDKIAYELDVSKQNHFNWDKDFETEIANFKSVELDNTDKLFDLMIKQMIIQKKKL